MLARSLVVGALAFAVGANPVNGAPTTTVVDIPTRDATQRFLYVRPDTPVANIVFLPGNTGVLGIENDGSMPTLPGRCAPFVRNRDAFASRGFALALVDRTSDGKIRQFSDIREVVRYVRSRDDVPTWIVGGSASTMAVIDFAIQLDEPVGVVVFSPGKLDVSRAELVKRPTLVIYHRDDAFSAPLANALFDALSTTLARERIALAGGTATDECGGHHLFRGIDAELVAAIAGFIGKYNSSLPRWRGPQ